MKLVPRFFTKRKQIYFLTITMIENKKEKKSRNSNLVHRESKRLQQEIQQVNVSPEALKSNAYKNAKLIYRCNR